MCEALGLNWPEAFAITGCALAFAWMVWSL